MGPSLNALTAAALAVEGEQAATVKTLPAAAPTSTVNAKKAIHAHMNAHARMVAMGTAFIPVHPAVQAMAGVMRRQPNLRQL